MTTIYLVRHGQKQSGSGDPRLSETGIRQAQETGEYLQQFPITQIVSSPFKRATETAKYIASVLRLERTVDNDLTERMNWDNKVPINEFFQEWNKATNDRSYVPKFGDSSNSTGFRMNHVVENLSEKNAHVILVSHGGSIVDYLRNVFGDEKVAILRKKYENGEDYQMMNCAVTKVVLSEQPGLELLNFTDHLTEITE